MSSVGLKPGGWIVEAPSLVRVGSEHSSGWKWWHRYRGAADANSGRAPVYKTKLALLGLLSKRPGAFESTRRSFRPFARGLTEGTNQTKPS